MENPGPPLLFSPGEGGSKLPIADAQCKLLLFSYSLFVFEMHHLILSDKI